MAAEYEMIRTARTKAGEGVMTLVGNTPLFPLPSLSPSPRTVRIYAKAEWHNPGGSVKDRAASNILLDGLRKGCLRPGKIILDATSGNTGIAYAMFGASLGYRVRLAVPENIGEEHKRILRAYGADLVFTDALEGADGAIRTARAISEENPDAYFYPDQYSNPANWQAHYNSTALEILRQTNARVTHFVAGLGTSGTFVGTARRLKEFNSNIKVVSIQPDSPLHGIEGLKHLESSLVPGIYDPGVADEDLGIATEEAQEMARFLARKQGLLVGVSAGAAALAVHRIAQSLNEGVIVTIFPDNGFKYVGERFWEER